MKNVKVSLGLALSFVLLLFSSQIYAQDSSRQGNIAYSNISFFAHGGEGVLDADFNMRFRNAFSFLPITRGSGQTTRLLLGRWQLK